MGRKVRRVPADWQHPKDTRGRYIPLFEGQELAARVAYWDLCNTKWQEGLTDDYRGGWALIDPEHVGDTYEEWAGPRPDPADYMPAWTPEQATYLMMYEDTSEGTPISPAFETPEELAEWLVANGASFFGGHTTTFDHWYRVITGQLWGGGVLIGDKGIVVDPKVIS